MKTTKIILSIINAVLFTLVLIFNIPIIISYGFILGTLIYYVLSDVREDKLINRSNIELQKIAYYDDLTGLPNRRFLSKKLDKNISQKTKFAALFLDFDGFKKINDTYGHNVGDLLLKYVSERIIRIVKEHDTVYRIGGDEFVILLEKYKSKKQLENISNRIIEFVNKPYDINGVKVKIGISIGICESKKCNDK
ncbi:MAG: GGDEF domain-containing protein, partial [Pseudomonadales bacterium]|nr:GGDEF domain-containing protein [Pseudomonadales bacterium]